MSALSAEIVLSLLEGAQIGLGVIDEHGRFVHVNDRLAEINGVPADGHTGRHFAEVLPGLAPALRGLIDRALASGQPIVSASVAGSTAALDAGAWDASYVPVQLGGGRGVGVLIIDATDRERAIAETRRRLSQQAALADLAQLALRSGDRGSVLDAATAMLVRELDADFAGVLQLDGTGERLVLRSGTGFPEGVVGTMNVPIGTESQAGYTLMRRNVVLTTDAATERRFTFTPALLELGVRCAMTMTIPSADGAFGVVGVLSRTPDQFDADDATALRATASVLGALIVRTGQEAQLSELAAQRGRLVVQALDTGEREHRQVADLLHDDALQHLLFARLELTSMDAEPEAKARVQASLDQAMSLIRNIAGGLHPTTLSHAGLAAALEALCGEMARESGLLWELHVEPSAEGVSDDLVHSIVRELLTNVVKHAGAEHARVRVGAGEDRIEIVVADDGRGMSPAQFDAVLLGETVGLANVRERVTAAGGTVDVRSGLDGRGTAVQLTLPR